MATFNVKQLDDGRALLNVGCGTHMHRSWNNLDFSIYTRLRRHMWMVSLLSQIGIISHPRLSLFEKVAPDVISWNLKHGIPFEPETFDVVYHSHVLEHIDREHVGDFLRECFRVSKIGGILRVVVPDLEKWARAYLRSFGASGASVAEADVIHHQDLISALLVQMVDREPTTRRAQKPLVRWLERRVLGDGAQVGWQHRWMYDRITILHLLERTGFEDCRVVEAQESRIAQWNTFGLDILPDGTEYKPESIWIEAVRRRPALENAQS
jgi:SAM-dependent methyltransferase